MTPPNVNNDVEIIGMLHSAGMFQGRPRPDIPAIADYFSINPGRLTRLLKELESGPRPQLLLLQNPSPEAKTRAAVFMSSVWSRSYAKLGNPLGDVHRDFHYQCLFSGTQFLVEVGCTHIRIENPLSGYVWQKDALICLFEAFDNIKRDVNPVIRLGLQEGTYDESMLSDIDTLRVTYRFEDHRPIGISPHIHDGLNMRTIFVEKRESALSMAGVWLSST